MASAAAFTFASSTARPHTFQEFQPRGGVWASACFAATILSRAAARPFGPVTDRPTTVVPAAFTEPPRMPVFGSSVTPAGRPEAEKASGPWPVAGMRNRNGRPGVVPTTRGWWMAGLGSVPEAIGTGGSGTPGRTTGTNVAPGPMVIRAPAQAAAARSGAMPPWTTSRSVFAFTRSLMRRTGSLP